VSSLPRSTPETQGLSAAALDSFLAALDASEQEIQTLMLVRHGHVVLEEEWSPYRLQDRHLLFSVSKSFTSMGIGLLVEAGLLSLDDKVVSFFDDEELPDKISDNLAAMRIRHLLTMTTGHSQDTIEALSRDRRMVRIFLGLDVDHQPGTVFVYNSGATYMLSAILQKLTGETLLDYLRPRLFEPLGATEATWEISKEGITKGGWGLSLNTDSLAGFGHLLLQRGQWEGQQLIPASWIDAATSRQVPNDTEENPDWHQGYGFQFWRGRHNTYRGDGAFGQYCLILPEHDTALIMTSASPDMQATLDVVWEHLLPALEGKPGDGTARPEKLEIPAPAGPAPSGDGRTYRFDRNHAALSAVRLDPDGTGTFTFEVGPDHETTVPVGSTQEVVCAPGGWQELRDELQDPPQRLLTNASADGDAFVATFRYLETPYVATLTCRPDGDSLMVDVKFNLSFGPTEFTLRSN
jgi:CubicO group peptidase (beta-lactamase class C family)